MGIPALLTLCVLYYTYTIPEAPLMEPPRPQERTVLPRRFWLYALAAAFMAAGNIDYPWCISCPEPRSGRGHGHTSPLRPGHGTDAISAMVLGKLFAAADQSAAAGDHPGRLFPVLAFSDSMVLIAAGMGLFGLGMGAQESIMRAVVADLAPVGRRATAYGYYNTVFGMFWFVGSLGLGMLYDLSIPVMIAISVGVQLISVPFS